MILLIALLPAAIFIHLLGHALGGLLFGLQVKSLNLFYGKPLVTIHFRTFPIRVGCLPTGGAVDFGDSIAHSSFHVKAFVTLSGPVALLLTSAACIRYDHAAKELISGFVQVIQGALSPMASGRSLVAQYYEQHGSSIAAAFGVLAAKLSAFNLLPIFPLNGGQIIVYAIPGSADSNWIMWAGTLGILAIFAMSLSWLVAVGAYLNGA